MFFSSDLKKGVYTVEPTHHPHMKSIPQGVWFTSENCATIWDPCLECDKIKLEKINHQLGSTQCLQWDQFPQPY